MKTAMRAKDTARLSAIHFAQTLPDQRMEAGELRKAWEWTENSFPGRGNGGIPFHGGAGRGSAPGRVV